MVFDIAVTTGDCHTIIIHRIFFIHVLAFFLPRPLAAVLCHRTAPLGPMPNEDIDWKNHEALEKYCSYTRYLRYAEEASNKEVWWKTYRKYVKRTSDNGKGFFCVCNLKYKIQIKQDFSYSSC